MTLSLPARAQYYLQYDLSSNLIDQSSSPLTFYNSNNIVGVLLGNVSQNIQSSKQSSSGNTTIDIKFVSEGSGNNTITIPQSETGDVTLGLLIVNPNSSGTTLGSVYIGPSSVPDSNVISTITPPEGGIEGINKVSLIYFLPSEDISTAFEGSSAFILNNELLQPGSVKQMVGFDLSSGANFKKVQGASNSYAVLVPCNINPFVYRLG